MGRKKRDEPYSGRSRDERSVEREILTRYEGMNLREAESKESLVGGKGGRPFLITAQREY